MSAFDAPTVLQGKGFSAQLVRSARRRTLTIQVKRGEVLVRAPVGMPPGDIEAFVQRKTSWIIRHLQRQPPPVGSRSLSDGEVLHHFGRPLVLQFMQGAESGVLPCARYLTVALDAEYLNCERSRRRVLERWYAQAALDYIEQRLPGFARQLRVESGLVKVRHYKARWGSCNHRGELQFNWLLAMAPEAVFDYVIVHELCHLRHFNHSPAFWRLVATVLPSYTEQRRWLQHQTYLNWF